MKFFVYKTYLKIFFLFVFLALTSCKIDFEGDLYTSDLLNIASDGGSINLPMEIRFQISSCGEDLTGLNNELATYFIDYKQINCGAGEDFMDYITSKVSVPIYNNLEQFNSENKSLIGYQSTIWEGQTKPYVYIILNLNKFEDLSNYIENETFQKLSLDEGILKVSINNDIDTLKLSIFPSFVEGEPIVFRTTYDLEKRQNLLIESSNISAMHLQKIGWAPLFIFE